MSRLRILTLIAVILAFIVFRIKNHQPSTIVAGTGLLADKTWLATNPHPIIPQKDVRPPDQTFLTYPEWFLVFSPAEQADYFKINTSTTFPYMKHVDQLWKGYSVVYDQIKGNYPFNSGYHVMIMVIGVSTTVEYSIKSFYETIIGRTTNTGPNEEMTAEDKFNAAYENSYVKFIEDLPWYQYNFNEQLKNLWINTPFLGQHLMRKMERRYYLTTELMIKSGYGWLIGLGTKSAYGTALLNTSVVINKLPDLKFTFGSSSNAQPVAKGMYILDLPRYAKFSPAAAKLAATGVNFKEIAGNKGAIMMTILTNKNIKSNDIYKVLFTQPIVTKPGLSRIALVTTVNNLSPVVQEFIYNKITIEHIFDY